MRWRKIAVSVPIWLLLLVMASQVYSMARQFFVALSPVVISTYAVDYNKCSVGLIQIGGVLSSGLQHYGSVGDAQDVIVSKLAGDQLRITMQLKNPGAPAFEEETRLLKTLVHCSNGPQCDANATTATPGCEITEAEFRPLGWKMSEVTQNRVDALAVIALLIEAGALYFLLRKSKNVVPAGTA